MQALLGRFVNDKKIGGLAPINPVLLPGAQAEVKLSLFLEAFTWVDLRNGLSPDGLERLQWEITGEKTRGKHGDGFRRAFIYVIFPGSGNGAPTAVIKLFS